MRRRTMRTRTCMANCTHVDMDRTYGRDQQCHVCGNPPSIGFLYECRQDFDTESLRDMLLPKEDRIRVPKSDLRVGLEEAGLSESVILTAEQGDYTAAQLELLKKQKQELKQIIADVLQGSQINNVVARLTAAPSNHDGTPSSKLTKDAKCPPACKFKACVTCRPYFRDRSYISFQDVLSANFAPVTSMDVQLLPTKSAQVMRDIGNTVHTYQTAPLSLPTLSTGAPQTGSTTSGSSELTFKTTQTDLDNICAQRRPRRRFYRIGHRSSGEIARDLTRLPPLLTPHGLKTAVQGIFRPSRESSSEGSNITLPLPRTGTGRNANGTENVGEFDLGALRRVRRQKERNEVKNGTYAGGFEDVSVSPLTLAHGTFVSASASVSLHVEDGDGDGDGAKNVGTFDSSEVSVYSCVSKGSEVEVNGGVALTEEAVETQTPDILAIDVSGKGNRSEAISHINEVESDEDEDADAGMDEVLQSIMTQR